MVVHVVYTGRSYQQAGALPETLTLADDASLADALDAIRGLLPGEQALPPSCLLSVSGQHLGTLASHRERPLSDGDELVLIAPVAGG